MTIDVRPVFKDKISGNYIGAYIGEGGERTTGESSVFSLISAAPLPEIRVEANPGETVEGSIMDLLTAPAYYLDGQGKLVEDKHGSSRFMALGALTGDLLLPDNLETEFGKVKFNKEDLTYKFTAYETPGETSTKVEIPADSVKKHFLDEGRLQTYQGETELKVRPYYAYYGNSEDAEGSLGRMSIFNTDIEGASFTFITKGAEETLVGDNPEETTAPTEEAVENTEETPAENSEETPVAGEKTKVQPQGANTGADALAGAGLLAGLAGALGAGGFALKKRRKG